MLSSFLVSSRYNYDCFLLSSRFVLVPCVRYDYNSLKSCWFCNENLLLSCCAVRDTHFSALVIKANFVVSPFLLFCLG